MINKLFEKYLYLQPEISIYKDLEGFFTDRVVKEIDIIIDISNQMVLNEETLSLLNEIHLRIKKVGFCMVLIKKNHSNALNYYNLICIPTLQEAKDYIEIEHFQRNLGI
jgi:predicted transcriptional regulator